MAKSFIKSVSMNEEMFNFLENNAEISLSKIIQNKLMEIMEFQKQCSGCLKIKNHLIFRERALRYLEHKGLTEEFCDFK